jgi:hypothetical protein
MTIATGKDIRVKTASEMLLRESLCEIPTFFGRLVFLNSCRDVNTGQYEYFSLSQDFGDDAANDALEAAHVDTYRKWLRMNLEEQKADLVLYLFSLAADRKQILSSWIYTTPYMSIIPARVKGPEREIFVSDIRALLNLLRNEYEVGEPDEDSLPIQ